MTVLIVLLEVVACMALACLALFLGCIAVRLGAKLMSMHCLCSPLCAGTA